MSVGRRDCVLERLPPAIRARFTPLPTDPFVEAFARGEHAAPHSRVKGALHGVLRRVVSDFDADGVLGTHPMALFGEVSWRALVGERGGRLLDVGAGSGDVTVHARPFFDAIVTTETSSAMAHRLRSRGFVCHRVDLARHALPDDPSVGGPFDVVALLNVLDRCDRPRALLRAAVRSLSRDGRVLLSVPLPARPHVDRGAMTVDPDEPMGGEGGTWEEALGDLVEHLVLPCGLEVTRVARAPYLSRGTRLHVLDAAVLVLAPLETSFG